MRLWHPQTGELQIVNYGAFPQNMQSNYRRVQMAISWNANLVCVCLSVFAYSVFPPFFSCLVVWW